MSAGARFLPSTVRIGLYNLQGLEEKYSETRFFFGQDSRGFFFGGGRTLTYIEVCKNITIGAHLVCRDMG